MNSVEENAPKSNSQKKLSILIGVVVLVVVIVIAVAVFAASSDLDDSNASLPANTCPEEIIQNTGNISVKYDGQSYPVSESEYQWILDNCETSSQISNQQNKKPAEVLSSQKPVLKNLAISFGKYDEMTGRAGAFIFDKAALNTNSPEPKIFFEFGSTIQTSEGEKKFPEIIYNQIDLDTDILSMTDGKVVESRFQQESNDYAVSVVMDDNWAINYDHLTGVAVKVGDQVKAGEVLGKPGVNKDGETGFTEISLKQVGANNKATYYCPIPFLSIDVVSDYELNFTDLMNDWEEYIGDDSIYNQADQPFAGCVDESFSD